MTNQAQKSKFSIQRILVVVDPERIPHTEPRNSGLLQRAIQLARTSGAELELFYPYYDSSLELGMFANREDVNREKELTRGESEVDLEMAITNPENVFETPQAVIDSGHLSRNLRERILDLWDRDVRARLTLEDEGGSVKSSPADLLKKINSAKKALAQKKSNHAG